MNSESKETKQKKSNYWGFTICLGIIFLIFLIFTLAIRIQFGGLKI
jgi:hypothetical protein